MLRRNRVQEEAFGMEMKTMGKAMRDEKNAYEDIKQRKGKFGV
jgi:hypothetical protein